MEAITRNVDLELEHERSCRQERARKRLHKCDLCPRTFATQSQASSHRDEVHIQSRDFPCQHCGQLSSRHNLKRHESSHLGTSERCCRDCGITYSRPDSFAEHQKLRDPTECKICSICQSNFDTLCEYNKHTRPGQVYTCCICQNKTFSTSTNRSKHALFHSNDRPEKRLHCEREFKSKAILKKHETRRHSAHKKNTKTYACDRCNITCKEPDSLRLHRLKEHGLIESEGGCDSIESFTKFLVSLCQACDSSY